MHIQVEVPFAHFTEKMGLIWLNQHLLCPHYNNNFLQNTCKYPYIYDMGQIMYKSQPSGTSQLQIHDSTMNIVLIHTYRLECFSTIQISIGIGYNFNHHYA